MKRINGKRYQLLLFASSKAYISLDKSVPLDSITTAPRMTQQFIDEYMLVPSAREGSAVFESAQVYNHKFGKIIGEVSYAGLYSGKAWKE